MDYHDLSIDTLEALVEEKAPLILDMRDQQSFENGHLDGAVPAEERAIRKALKNRQQAVVVYCYHGHSSRELCTFLSQMGISEVYNLEGGWQAVAAFMDRKHTLSIALQQWLTRYGFRGNDPVQAVRFSRIENAMSALMIAALDGEQEIAGELLELGADLHAVNSDGNQPLWFACVGNDIPTLNLLLKAGADCSHLNHNGFSPLMYAASTGRLAIVDALLAAGGEALQQSPDGMNAIDYATTLPVLRRLQQHNQSH